MNCMFSTLNGKEMIKNEVRSNNLLALIFQGAFFQMMMPIERRMNERTYVELIFIGYPILEWTLP